MTVRQTPWETYHERSRNVVLKRVSLGTLRVKGSGRPRGLPYPAHPLTPHVTYGIPADARPLVMGIGVRTGGREVGVDREAGWRSHGMV
jgi:hypothetical protein